MIILLLLLVGIICVAQKPIIYSLLPFIRLIKWFCKLMDIVSWIGIIILTGLVIYVFIKYDFVRGLMLAAGTTVGVLFTAFGKIGKEVKRQARDIKFDIKRPTKGFLEEQEELKTINDAVDKAIEDYKEMTKSKKKYLDPQGVFGLDGSVNKENYNTIVKMTTISGE